MSAMETPTEERRRLERARIFISYRRRETAGHAGRLYDKLSEHFGADRVFMDLTMEPGVDFADTINEAVGECGALVALIGNLDGSDALGANPVNSADTVLHVALAALGILTGLISRSDDRRHSAPYAA